MSKQQHFQPLQYTLIIRDQVGRKITGTGSIYDLEGTRTLAESVFRVNRSATFVDIHPYVEGGSYANTALETVHRTGIRVAPLSPITAKESGQPAAPVSTREIYEVSTVPAEASAEIVEPEAFAEAPVEQTPVEQIPTPRRRDRRAKATQEAS